MNQLLSGLSLRFICLTVFVAAMLFLPAPASAAEGTEPFNLGGSWVLGLLAPLGLALIASAASPPEKVAGTALTAVLAFGLAIPGYYLFGFAWQFGGLGLWHSASGYAGLSLHWSALGVEYGRQWGMLGLRGFLLAGDMATPEVYRLFLSQLPLVVMATLLPMLALHDRVPRAGSLLAGAIGGLILFPILGNWAWGGGWLAQIGSSLEYGHGLIDVGGAGVVHLAGASIALASAICLPRRKADNLPPTLPSAHLPVLGLLGAMLLPLGWTSLILSQPWVDWWPLSTETILLNLVLGAATGALLPAVYVWFVSRRVDPLWAGRGMIAGLLTVTAGAPFLPPHVCLLAGGVAGLLLPGLTYLVREKWRLEDHAGLVVTHGLGGMVGLLLPAFFASGGFGVGWNWTNDGDYLGVAGQGVTGLWPAAGFQPDWPGQFLAQIIGAGAFVFAPAAVMFLAFGGGRVAHRVWMLARRRRFANSPGSDDNETATRFASVEEAEEES